MASREILRTHTERDDNDRDGGSSNYVLATELWWRRTTRSFGRRHNGRAHVHAKRTVTTTGWHKQVKVRVKIKGHEEKVKARRRRTNADHWLSQNRCGATLASKTKITCATLEETPCGRTKRRGRPIGNRRMGRLCDLITKNWKIIWLHMD